MTDDLRREPLKMLASFYATAPETRALKKVYSSEKQISFATRSPRSPVFLMNFTSLKLMVRENRMKKGDAVGCVARQ